MTNSSDAPLLSVCIPAYNHEKYVAFCLRSIMEQDWSRIELLVVDDGSKDGTWSELQRLRPECEQRFERVEMVTQSNQGVCVSHLRLLDMAHGDFVAMIASDDAYAPEALSALMRPLLADAAIGVAVGVNALMDGEGRECYWDAERNVVYDRAKARYRTFNEYLTEATDVAGSDAVFGTYAALVRGNHIPNGYVMRRTDLDKITPYRRDAPLDDFWLHLQLSKVTRYKMIPDVTFRYRWHAANTVRQQDRILRMGYETLKCEERAVAALSDGRWSKAFADATRTEKVRFRFGHIVSLAKVATLEEKYKILRIGSREFVFAHKSRIPMGIGRK